MYHMLSFGQLLLLVIAIPGTLLMTMVIAAIVDGVKRRIAGKHGRPTLEERLQSGNVTLGERLDEARRLGLLSRNDSS